MQLAALILRSHRCFCGAKAASKPPAFHTFPCYSSSSQHCSAVRHSTTRSRYSKLLKTMLFYAMLSIPSTSQCLLFGRGWLDSARGNGTSLARAKPLSRAVRHLSPSQLGLKKLKALSHFRRKKLGLSSTQPRLAPCRCTVTGAP